MIRLFLFILLPIFAVLGCNKTVSHNGKVWWQSDDSKKQGLESPQIPSKSDYDSSVFVNGNNDKQKTNSYSYTENNYNTYNHNDLTDALNKNSRNSALSQQEWGQIEFTNREQFQQKNNQFKQQKPVQYSIPAQQQTCNCKCPQQKENVKVENKEMKKGYKIQCGNYENKEGAQKVANKIKKAGIKDVNIITENGSSKILVGNFNSKSEGQEIFDKIEELNLNDNIFWLYK